MSTVLVTGASGWIGSNLAARLSEDHDTITLSRSAVEVDGVTAVRGDFASPEDLFQLDRFEIDTVVHVAAVLETATEEECLAVNVLGTARLLRYAAERGCRHFVLASSVAATGCMSDRFLPRELPIGDDHPCFAFEPYGLSKALMEEQAYYLQRQRPELEISLIRIGGVVGDDAQAEEAIQGLRTEMPFLLGGIVHLDRLIDDFAIAIERPLGPGVRRFNSVDPLLTGSTATAPELRESLGDPASPLDTSYYEEPGRERASYFVADSLRDAYAGASA